MVLHLSSDRWLTLLCVSPLSSPLLPQGPPSHNSYAGLHSNQILTVKVCPSCPSVALFSQQASADLPVSLRWTTVAGSPLTSQLWPINPDLLPGSLLCQSLTSQHLTLSLLGEWRETSAWNRSPTYLITDFLVFLSFCFLSLYLSFSIHLSVTFSFHLLLCTLSVLPSIPTLPFFSLFLLLCSPGSDGLSPLWPRLYVWWPVQLSETLDEGTPPLRHVCTSNHL